MITFTWKGVEENVTAFAEVVHTFDKQNDTANEYLISSEDLSVIAVEDTKDVEANDYVDGYASKQSFDKSNLGLLCKSDSSNYVEVRVEKQISTDVNYTLVKLAILTKEEAKRLFTASLKNYIPLIDINDAFPSLDVTTTTV